MHRLTADAILIFFAFQVYKQRFSILEVTVEDTNYTV